MQQPAESFAFKSPLTFYEAPQLGLRIPPGTLSLLKDGQQIIGCHLRFRADFCLYERIEKNQLFHLTADIKSRVTGGRWQSGEGATIEITLHPEHLDSLQGAASAQSAIANLVQLSKTQPDHLLFQTESWYLVSASQRYPQGEIKYRTLWSYLDLQSWQQPTPELLSGLDGFIKDSVYVQQLLEEEDGLDEQFLAQVVPWCRTLIQSSSPATLLDNFAEELVTVFRAILKGERPHKALEELGTNEVSLLQSVPTSSTLSLRDQVKNFLIQDRWKILDSGDPETIWVSFVGASAIWNCYVLPREADQELIFYSLFPFPVPPEKRRDMAEFICRANYGLGIGNFELDFTDGEIRYKTSIDVTNSELTPALIRNVIYANVVLFDRYFSGILEVIEGEANPEAAIERIEAMIPV